MACEHVRRLRGASNLSCLCSYKMIKLRPYLVHHHDAVVMSLLCKDVISDILMTRKNIFCVFRSCRVL